MLQLIQCQYQEWSRCRPCTKLWWPISLKFKVKPTLPCRYIHQIKCVSKQRLTASSMVATCWTTSHLKPVVMVTISLSFPISLSLSLSLSLSRSSSLFTFVWPRMTFCWFPYVFEWFTLVQVPRLVMKREDSWSLLFLQRFLLKILFEFVVIRFFSLLFFFNLLISIFLLFFFFGQSPTSSLLTFLPAHPHASFI